MNSKEKQIIESIIEEMSFGNIYEFTKKQIILIFKQLFDNEDKQLTLYENTLGVDLNRKLQIFDSEYKKLVLRILNSTKWKNEKKWIEGITWEYSIINSKSYKDILKSIEMKIDLKFINIFLQTNKYSDIYTFVKKQLLRIINNHIKLNSKKIEFYEKKYGSLEILKNKFHDLTQFNIIEKEDEEWYWEDAIELLDIDIKILKKIESAENIK